MGYSELRVTMRLNTEDRALLWEYFYNGGDTPPFLYEAFMDDMPYGTAKARTGDPDNWLADNQDLIEDRYCEELEAESVRRSFKL